MVQKRRFLRYIICERPPTAPATPVPGKTTIVTYLGCLMSNFSMKSLAADEMSSNSSASKSNSAAVTLANVSLSESPANGDRPDKLEPQQQQRQLLKTVAFLLLFCSNW